MTLQVKFIPSPGFYIPNNSGLSEKDLEKCAAGSDFAMICGYYGEFVGIYRFHKSKKQKSFDIASFRVKRKTYKGSLSRKRIKLNGNEYTVNAIIVTWNIDKKAKQQIGLVWKTHNGVGIEYFQGSHGGCHGNPYTYNPAEYVKKLAIGGFYIDKTSCSDANLVKGVISGPMVSLELKRSEIDKCPEPSDIMCAGLQGGFKTLALTKKFNKNWSGLDSISLIDYAEFWLDLGAKVYFVDSEGVLKDFTKKSMVPDFVIEFE